jgi:hypothetical protein
MAIATLAIEACFDSHGVAPSSTAALGKGHGKRIIFIPWRILVVLDPLPVACPLEGLANRCHARLTGHSAEERCSSEQGSYGSLTDALPATLLNGERPTPFWL